jgi:hypothetical protein
MRFVAGAPYAARAVARAALDGRAKREAAELSSAISQPYR